MKTKILIMFLVLLSAGLRAQAFEGGDHSGGGDSVSQEFVAVAKLVVERLGSTDAAPSVDVGALSKAITQTRVESSDVPLTKDSVRKDALNFPFEHRIVVDRSRWAALDKQHREALVLHEYLGIMQVDDSTNKISSDLLLQSLRAKRTFRETYDYLAQEPRCVGGYSYIKDLVMQECKDAGYDICAVNDWGTESSDPLDWNNPERQHGWSYSCRAYAIAEGSMLSPNSQYETDVDYHSFYARPAWYDPCSPALQAVAPVLTQLSVAQVGFYGQCRSAAIGGETKGGKMIIGLAMHGNTPQSTQTGHACFTSLDDCQKVAKIIGAASNSNFSLAVSCQEAQTEDHCPSGGWFSPRPVVLKGRVNIYN